MTIVLGSLILVAFIALYFYLVQKNKYWQNRGVTCADGAWPGVGHMLSILCMRTTFAEHCSKIYHNNRDRSMLGIYRFMTPLLLILEPEVIKTVLQTNFTCFDQNVQKIDPDIDPLIAKHPFFSTGDQWIEGRKRLTYALSSKRLKILLESVRSVCTTLENYLDKLSKVDGKVEMELKDLFSKYTAQIVAATGFSVDGCCFDDEETDVSFQKIGKQIFGPSIFHKIKFITIFLSSLLNKIFKLSIIPKHIDRFFRMLVANLMEQRRKQEIPRYDFLDLMAKLERSKNNKIDLEELTSYLTTFFVDGYVTSSIAMSFIGFLIASHPEVQEKLRKEVMSILDKYNGVITYEGLMELTYMDQVFYETLRFQPAIPFMFKRCMKEFKLRGSDGLVCRVEPGTEVFISIQDLHKDPRYWKDPEIFDPERFNPDRRHSIEKFTFLPFSEGPRACVGTRMAMMKMKMCFVTILKKYRLELSPKTQLPLKIEAIFLPEVKGGLWIFFRQL